MEIIEEQNQEYHYTFKISLSGKELEKEITRRLQQLAKTTKIAGFRPGKVPMHIIRERFSERVSAETVHDKITESMRQLLAEREIYPAFQPVIHLQERQAGEDLLFSIDVDVIPTIELPNFSDITLEKWTVEVSEELIQDSIQNLLDQYSPIKPPPQPRPIQDQDVLLLNYKLFHQGEIKAIQDNLQIRIGKDTLKLGRTFEEHLIGLTCPQETEIELVLPQNVQFLSGETVQIKLTIQEMYEVEEQQLDDDLARKLGVQNVDEVKKMIELNWAYQIERLSLLHTRSSLLNYLEKHYKCPIPKPMVQDELEKIWTQYQKQQQEKSEEYMYQKQTRQEFDAEYTATAERRVFLGIFFLEVTRQHNIVVEEHEVDEYLQYVARQNKNQSTAKSLHLLKTNKPLIQAITNEILEHKVVEFILDKINFQTKNVPLEQLQQAVPSN